MHLARLAIIFEAMTFGAPRRQRQHGIQTVQSLNRSLLIDAEHGGMLLRIHIQTDDIRRFHSNCGSSEAM